MVSNEPDEYYLISPFVLINVRLNYKYVTFKSVVTINTFGLFPMGPKSINFNEIFSGSDAEYWNTTYSSNFIK